MDILNIKITGYEDICLVEDEVCRLLRCHRGRCAALHTESFVMFRTCLFKGEGSDKNTARFLQMPEGLTLSVIRYDSDVWVNFSWEYSMEFEDIYKTRGQLH